MEQKLRSKEVATLKCGGMPDMTWWLLKRCEFTSSARSDVRAMHLTAHTIRRN